VRGAETMANRVSGVRVAGVAIGFAAVVASGVAGWLGVQRLERRWLADFREADAEHDCCQAEVEPIECAPARRRLLLASRGPGDGAYVASTAFARCEATRARAGADRRRWEAERARMQEEAAREQEARARAEAEERARPRPLRPSHFAFCEALPKEDSGVAAGPDAAAHPSLESLPRLAPPVQYAAFRRAICQRSGETADSLRRLPAAMLSAVMCELPWRTATENVEEVLRCGEAPGPDPEACRYLVPSTDIEAHACDGHERAIERAYLAAQEDHERAWLKGRIAALRADPAAAPDELLAATLRLDYGASVVGEVLPLHARAGTRPQGDGPSRPPDAAEIARLRAAIGDAPADALGAASDGLVHFLRSGVPGEGPVLLLLPCARKDESLRGGVYWISPVRTLVLRPFGPVDEEEGCPEPVDLADLDADGEPEVVAQGHRAAFVLSVGSSGARLRWSEALPDSEGD